MVHSAADIDNAFRQTVLALHCPHCAQAYTSAAVQWGDAWHEGRRDLLVEQALSERDGPYKLKCEACDGRAWLNIFAMTVSAA